MSKIKILILFMNGFVIYDAFHFWRFFHFRRFSLLKSLCDVSQSDCKSLYCRERILEIQSICIVVDSAKLHNLQKNVKINGIGDFWFKIKFFTDTVKLGYNELGYNEHPVITNKKKSNGWFQSFLWRIFSVITNKTRL